MKTEEEEAFEKTFGYKPTRISVALDCLAVYVHKDNPVKGLSLAQVDGIFSKTRKLGGPNIATWGDLGVTGDLAALPISLYGRNSASGTYAFFKEHALGKGDFKDEVKEQPGSAAVVQGVAKDRAGIGYSGIGYRTSEVRALPLAKKAGGALVEPTFENALRRQVSAGPGTVRLRQQEAQRTAAAAGEGVHQVRALEGGPGSGDQGRLRSVAEVDDREAAEADREVVPACTPRGAIPTCHDLKRRDRIARWVITLGGLIVIASVVAILAADRRCDAAAVRDARGARTRRDPAPAAAARPRDVLAVGIELPVHGPSGHGPLGDRDGTVSFSIWTRGR